MDIPDWINSFLAIASNSSLNKLATWPISITANTTTMMKGLELTVKIGGRVANKIITMIVGI
jgi:hypothetical protein